MRLLTVGMHCKRAISSCFGMSTRPFSLGRRLFSSSNNEDDDQGSNEEPAQDDLIAVAQQDFSLAKPSIPPPELCEVTSIAVARRPLFPGYYKTISIVNPKASALLSGLLRKGTPWIGIFLQRQEAAAGSNSSERKDLVGALSEIYPTGVLAQLVNLFPNPTALEPNAVTAIVLPHRRILATELLRPESGRLRIESLADEAYDRRGRVLRAISQEIFAVLSDIAKLNGFFREHVMHHNVPSAVFEDAAKLADFVSVLCSASAADLQRVLEASDVEARLRLALELLKQELTTAQLQNSIAKDVEAKLSARQREYFLQEQLKVIKKELGLETDSKERILEQLRQKMAPKLAALTQPVRTAWEEELAKLAVLEANGSEFNVTRNYLDWLAALPWGKQSVEALDVGVAAAILDEDHFGLQDVKNRILEFIAVGKLRGSVAGKIICLVGPPGTGKTSIARSISRALSRQYFRFSVGGLGDASEIKGHRRTYVGAMPGKIVQALKAVGTENPLILIDEIDKLGSKGFAGDPASTMLELLDPEQNSSFLDHYLDVPIDLSRVLFVCTANLTDSIPAPLLDRMELITLSGYVAEEKKQIALRYLMPTAEKESGLAAGQAVIEEPALQLLIGQYARENGVRSLKKLLEKIYRKIALLFVRANNAGQQQPGNIRVTAASLTEYVGQPPFAEAKIYPDATPAGVAMGLAWTSLGGSILYVETCSNGAVEPAAQPLLTRTGQLGKVMEESSSIAYTFARRWLAANYPACKFLEGTSVHLHVPEGAIPKDGPSAGITMACCLCSLALAKAVQPLTAMTGEITLTGKVLKIGGLKEKTIAAANAGVRRIIFPAANAADWHEIPAYIRQDIEAFPVATFDEVYAIAFK